MKGYICKLSFENKALPIYWQENLLKAAKELEVKKKNLFQADESSDTDEAIGDELINDDDSTDTNSEDAKKKKEMNGDLVDPFDEHKKV